MRTARRLLEITSFPLSMRGRLFFYGIADAEEAKAVYLSGELPVRSLKRPRKGFADSGHVQLSTRLEDALEAAALPLGRKMAAPRIKQLGRYGFIFTTSPASLSDIQPDEASVGAFVQQLYQLQYGKGSGLDSVGMEFLSFAWGVLDREQQIAIIHDDEDARVLIGRDLLRKAPDRMILWMLTQTRYPYDLSNVGAVPFEKVFRFDRTLLRNSSEDSFFEDAEEITDGSIFNA